MTEAAGRVSPADEGGDWLEQVPCRVGQVLVDCDAEGRVTLQHRDDAERTGLDIYTAVEAAIAIARFDDGGAYRSLKTAPNLRHGWLLVLPSLAEAERALEFFYPGRSSAYRAWQRNELRITSFRETLGRQSGMYRAAAKIGDAEVDELIGNFCRSDGGCLRTILWRRDAAGTRASSLLPPEKFDLHHDQTGRVEPTLPLLCQESCNLLVAAARKVVKSE